MGEDVAYQAFFKEHRDDVLVFVQRRRAAYNANADAVVDVGEVVQETMLAALEDWPRVRALGQPGSWLRRIANNKLIDQIRRATKRKDIDIPFEELQTDRDPSPPSGLELVLARDTLVEALAKLSPTQREILDATMSGLSVHEIAGQMGVSLDAVYKNRNRARQMIRELQQRSHSVDETPLTPAERSRERAQDRTRRSLDTTLGAYADEQLAQRYPELSATFGQQQIIAERDRHIRLFERLLEERAHALGDNHPDTVSVRGVLAHALHAAGRHDDAVPLLEQALRDRERAHGSTHNNTTAIRIELAEALSATKRHTAAAALYEQIHLDQKRFLGTYHPHTLRTRRRLAEAYRGAGETSLAIAHFTQALADHKRILGHSHDDTLRVRAQLAAVLHTDMQYERAVPLLEAVHRDRTRKFGPHHRCTIEAHKRLVAALTESVAESLYEAGDYERAIPVFEQIFAGGERRLGANQYPDLRRHFADALEKRDRLPEALIHYTELRDLYLDKHGPDHDKTLSSRQAVARVLMKSHELERAITERQMVVDAYRRVHHWWPTTEMSARLDLYKALIIYRGISEQREYVPNEQMWPTQTSSSTPRLPRPTRNARRPARPPDIAAEAA
ncbi:sigma-70 family RNA polymerase sigma factor [Nocardia bovistercoris]|uniref:Sigma-70 family RNA polymerase sigma factor n=1 Tax=Nocardia bovistercoris TaxID=2785916 RepID=A0A931N6D3_9NOCA|nr:sigma-70 family RNA polymerase sigma factor [Nocardia bovistercoris]MBH0780381.1 sigma-70 family RNA polymerase sigma factor [Nocardia bovistercoris]